MNIEEKLNKLLTEYVNNNIEVYNINFYDGVISDLVYSKKLNCWGLLQLCYFETSTFKKIYFLSIISNQDGSKMKNLYEKLDQENFNEKIYSGKSILGKVNVLLFRTKTTMEKYYDVKIVSLQIDKWLFVMKR